MPLPNASRVFESPALEALPRGPYAETVEEVRIASRGHAEVGFAEAVVLLVLEGRIDTRSLGSTRDTIGAREAILVEPGASLVVTNPGDGPTRLLKFALTTSSSGS